MKIPFHLTSKQSLMLAALIFAAGVAVWLIRRQRRLIRADLENRGLVPSRRRRRHRSGNEKRNPTLAEKGTGLPPVRLNPPPGPIL